MSGAVDLSVLKERAEAQRARAAAPAPQPGAEQQAPGPPPEGASIIDVTEATFESDVVARSDSQLVITLLWAGWSEPSVQLAQLLEQLAARAAGAWTLARVDVDVAPRIAQAFGAQSVPIAIALAGGQPVSAFDGRQPLEQVGAWLDEVTSKMGIPAPDAGVDEPEPEDDPRMVAAEELLNSGDFDGALAAYEAIVALEPTNTEAASAARNVKFMIRAQEHDPTILETAQPGDIDAQFAAADVLLLGQRPEQAFDRIIDVVRSADGDDKARARTRLLELFELFDPAEPFVVSARRKLAAALY
ncbi:tetratricopeptide repeat protein [Gordonia sp. HY285]|uniref:Tetratricopeptide repeat protein n=1 Tax=Gordonia liuliyuniae TaxID=2911517 RepID=A0ABS9IS88_9ACTN|nr:tetratricopeptide repeat protein [Gordonia liuliyuniae]MCF8588409.1 tetratricopeptide repeat protein [Gordonia liuliyuniae]MCF8611105.1 tetratricopeptide repeat protein [Gordonia liuliyuniae]